MLTFLIILIVIWLACGIWMIENNYDVNFPITIFLILTIVLLVALEKFFK